MPILLTNPKDFAERREYAKQSYAEGLRLAMAAYLRDKFDNSLIDYQPLAIIQLAKENGFNELAEEMESDFESETGAHPKHFK